MRSNLALCSGRSQPPAQAPVGPGLAGGGLGPGAQDILTGYLRLYLRFAKGSPTPGPTPAPRAGARSLRSLDLLRLSARNGSWDGAGWVPGIAPLRTTQVCTTLRVPQGPAQHTVPLSARYDRTLRCLRHRTYGRSWTPVGEPRGMEYRGEYSHIRPQGGYAGQQWVYTAV